jgi:hypothetical protein
MLVRFAVTTLLAVLLTSSLVSGQGTTPGFQNTPNNYGVGMNPENECRHPPSYEQRKCSQHFYFRFQANTDGTVNAPFDMTNDSLEGFYGSVRIIARDRANPPGNVLLDVTSGVYCIPGKGGDTNYHERRQHVDWTFKANPSVGLNGHDLYMVPVEYRGTGLNFLQPAQDAIGTIGAVVQLTKAVIAIGAL